MELQQSSTNRDDITAVLRKSATPVPEEEDDDADGLNTAANVTAIAVTPSSVSARFTSAPSGNLANPTPIAPNTASPNRGAARVTAAGSRSSRSAAADATVATPTAEPAEVLQPALQPARFAVTTVHKNPEVIVSEGIGRRSVAEATDPPPMDTLETSDIKPAATAEADELTGAPASRRMTGRFQKTSVRDLSSPEAGLMASPSFATHQGLLAPPDLDSGHRNNRVVPLPNARAAEYLRYFHEADGMCAIVCIPSWCSAYPLILVCVLCVCIVARHGTRCHQDSIWGDDCRGHN